MIISFIEREFEMLELEEWTNEEDIPMPNLDTIAELLKNPPKRCEDKNECVSYELSADNCRCIRSVFAHKSHYELWKMLAEEKIRSELIEVLEDAEKQYKEENLS